MNFKVIFLTKESINPKFFRSSETALVLLENKIIDFPSRSTLITSLNTTNISFLQVMDFTELCFIVPQQEFPINYLIPHFKIFNFHSQISLIITSVVLVIIMYIIEFIRSKMGQKHDSFADLTLIVVQAQTMNSIHNFSKYNNRAILILVVIFYFLICSIYQGVIASILVQEPKAKKIDSLEYVDQSGLNIISTDNYVFRPTSDDIRTNSIVYRLSKKQIRFVSVKLFYRKYNSTTKSAILTPTRNAKYLINILSDKKTGKANYRQVQEKVSRPYRSFIIPKDSPYRERFNELLFRIIESGFVKFEYSDIKKIDYVRHIGRTRDGFTEEPRKVVIKMEHLDLLIIIWIKCLSTSTIVFFLEIIFFHVKKRFF